MQSVDAIKKRIDAALRVFLKNIRAEYHLDRVNPLMYEGIEDFCLRPGKRIRPLLVVLSYQGYKRKRAGFSPSVYHAAICMELLHNFMLVHDDIIDRSELRRGKPTLHRVLRHAARTDDPEKLGYDLAIIAGDILYALAIDAFLSIKEQSSRKEAALRHFVKTAAVTAIGESVDILQAARDIRDTAERDVFLNYTLKTAHYTFECPLVIGAMLAGAPPKEIRKLSRLGIFIGQAFQIQDDIIGAFGSQKHIGKSILSDLAESKKTLLVAHAYRTLTPQKRKAFLALFLKPKKTYADLVTIRKIFIESGSLAYCIKTVSRLVRQSDTIACRLAIRPAYRAHLHQSLFTVFTATDAIARRYGINTSIGPT